MLWDKWSRLVFTMDADGGGSSGDGDDNGDGDDGDGGEEKKPPKKVEFTDEQQAEVNRIVQERLEREKKKRESEAQKVKEDAEAEALKKSQEWEKLAGKQEAELSRLKEFETEAKGKIEKLEGVLTDVLKSSKKGMPDHLVDLLDKLDIFEQMEYIAKNAEALKKPEAKGVPKTPAGKGDGKNEPGEDEKVQARQFYRSKF